MKKMKIVGIIFGVLMLIGMAAGEALIRRDEKRYLDAYKTGI